MSGPAGYLTLSGVAVMMRAAVRNNWTEEQCDECVDTLLAIQNERLRLLYESKNSIKEQFARNFGHLLPWGLEDQAISAMEVK